ncbi:MAG: hypothetical protein KDE34_02570 [Anaerolineales bacterium]|nr:hypothetical protein [Anaerolineales bacterium]
MQKLVKFYVFLLTAGLLLSTDSLVQDWAIGEAERAGYGAALVGMAGTIFVLLALVLMLLWAGLSGAE